MREQIVHNGSCASNTMAVGKITFTLENSIPKNEGSPPVLFIGIWASKKTFIEPSSWVPQIPHMSS